MIFQNEVSKWYRNCPSCNNILYYCSKSNCFRSDRNNCVCKSCATTGKNNPRFGKVGYNLGKVFSKEHRRKLSESHIGIIQTEEWKEKKAAHLRGKKRPSQVGDKVSMSLMGRKCSEEHRCNMRISKCERLIKLGISGCKDDGANKWISKMNEDGYNLEEGFYLKEQGYFADGYDKERRVWLEYDTPYHNRLKQRVKDEERQKNIIEYFERTGNPLSEFVRIDATNPDKDPMPKVVYKNKLQKSY